MVKLKGRDTVFSHDSDEWETPDDLYKGLDDLFHFTLDPCATHENAKCENYLTKQQDGLSVPWEGETVFVNPPYSESEKWIVKAYTEAMSGYANVVMLLPVRTSNPWFHEYILPYSSIYFIRGRLKFKGAQYDAPFPSMVVHFTGFREYIHSMDRQGNIIRFK